MTEWATNFADAVANIRPLRGQGPNYWTCDVKADGDAIGWGVSAPTVRQLVPMLRGFFDGGSDVR